MEVNHPRIIPIDKLMYWRISSWVKYENTNSQVFLRLHCDQILITNSNKVLESLNMNGRMKGIYKDDVLIIIICTGAQEIRKLKFQIKNDVTQNLQTLGEHFPVVNHKSSKGNCNMRYRKIEDVYKNVLEDYKVNAAQTSNLPSNFTNFAQLCLLDPAFPQIVHEIQNIIKKV